MYIKIKNDIVYLEDISTISFNDEEKSAFISFKSGMILIFGTDFIQGKVPRSRVITKEEFASIKEFFLLELKPKVAT